MSPWHSMCPRVCAEQLSGSALSGQLFPQPGNPGQPMLLEQSQWVQFHMEKKRRLWCPPSTAQGKRTWVGYMFIWLTLEIEYSLIEPGDVLLMAPCSSVPSRDGCGFWDQQWSVHSAEQMILPSSMVNLEPRIAMVEETCRVTYEKEMLVLKSTVGVYWQKVKGCTNMEKWTED